MMCKILLSINPKYVEKILNGEKLYEFRKTQTKRKPEKIIIYCTAPISAVVGEADVEDILVDTPIKLWNKTYKKGGVKNDFFFKYYEEKEVGVAYKLKNVKKYDRQKELSEYGINFAPQSFVYL